MASNTGCRTHTVADCSECVNVAIRRAELDAERELLRALLAKALDVIVLQGHAFGDEEWRSACLLSGRYCQPYIDPAATQGGSNDGCSDDAE